MGRPQLVNREKILEAALALGLEQLSMHKVARYLGVTTTTLYRYVSSKEALVDACVDEFCSRVVVPADSLDWPDYLHALGHGFRAALKTTPGAAAYGVQLGPTTPAAYAIFDRALSVLVKAGFSLKYALHAYSLVVEHSFTSAAKQERHLELTANYGKGGYKVVRDAAKGLEEFPTLTIALAQFTQPNFDELFDEQLTILIEGIRSTMNQRTETSQQS